MTKTILCALVLGLSFTAASGHADTFGTGLNTFTIDFVTIGNPGNADDRAYDNNNDTPDDPNDDEYSFNFGGVAYVYRIGVTEVPEEWITQATASGMTNVTAGAWTGSQPAGNMTWYEAAAFVNWLNTSTGHHAAYDLVEVHPPNSPNTWRMTLWTSGDAWQLGGENLYRHKDAYYFLPSEDEWYKAAYHKNDGLTANYWDYATGSNIIPASVTSGSVAGTAVYDPASDPASVYDNGGLSAYGTQGQNGNVYEYQESAIDQVNNFASEDRTIRGAGARSTELFLRSSYRSGFTASDYAPLIGFRVASVPEPSCAVLLLSGSLLALGLGRTRRIPGR